MYSKIWLSKPHFETDDLDYFKTTMESNWISTVGPNIASFERRCIQQKLKSCCPKFWNISHTFGIKNVTYWCW